MSGFFSNLNSRHKAVGIRIEPRLKSRYESIRSSVTEPAENINTNPKINNPIQSFQSEGKIQDFNKEIKKDTISTDPKKSYESGKTNSDNVFKPPPLEHQDSIANSRHGKIVNKPTEKSKSPSSKEEVKSTLIKTIRSQNIIDPLKANSEHETKGFLVTDKRIEIERLVEKNTNQLEKKRVESQPPKRVSIDSGKNSEIRIEKDKPGKLMPPSMVQNELIRHSENKYDRKNLSTHEETTVKVSIGKIEIKAINQTTPEKVVKRKPAPIMSLEEYLNHQKKDSR